MTSRCSFVKCSATLSLPAPPVARQQALCHKLLNGATHSGLPHHLARSQSPAFPRARAKVASPDRAGPAPESHSSHPHKTPPHFFGRMKIESKDGRCFIFELWIVGRHVTLQPMWFEFGFVDRFGRSDLVDFHERDHFPKMINGWSHRAEPGGSDRAPSLATLSSPLLYGVGIALSVPCGQPTSGWWAAVCLHCRFIDDLSYLKWSAADNFAPASIGIFGEFDSLPIPAQEIAPA